MPAPDASRRVALVLDSTDHDRLAKAAEAEHLPPSTYARVLVLRALKADQAKTKTSEVA